ncbi:hypothetical protein BFP72_06960 [Reichenbachiella sp. 5M10]|uniref:DUF4136 domain-containing protein n=1 Tax=Reichenbachiella sp. 5M10 TaxID=1889772 RepID=UPI000C14CB54|nr:DUF4136 domain-containing protein [Reichenbachiella sp. 5M10]PIB35154.1 hypothetical protein BFP72_06960 [Reichenbachiella sp. 5M10]
MKNILLALLLSSMIAGCYPDQITEADEFDIVVTTYDEELFQPNQYKTYAMPDSVLYQNDDHSTYHKFNGTILSSIKTNMTNYGYTRVDPNTTDPDILILPEVITTENYAAGGCWDCWWWYDPWYPGWGYYPPAYVYSYRTGSIIISMVTFTPTLPADADATSAWTGLVNGLLRDELTKSNIEEFIDQAYSQSPYLQTQ